MGKKKRKKTKNSTHQNNIPVEMLVEKADRALRDEDFRDACNHLKKLVNHDKDKYLPGLIAAYKELFKKLLETGHLQKAKIILTKLEKLNDRVIHYAEKILLSIARGDFYESPQLASGWLASGNSYKDEEKIIIADGLMVGFQENEMPEIPDIKIKSEYTAVQSALRDVTRQNYDAAAESLRSVGTRSMFFLWKMFIKGLIFFYKGDDEKALRAFEKLPASSVPGKSARAYSIIIGNGKDTGEQNKDMNLLKNICLLAGEKRLVNILPRADYLWRVGRFRDSYRHVADKLDGFPSEEHGIENSLTTFYFNSVLYMEEEQAYKYMDFIFDRMFDDSFTNKTENLFAFRTEYLLAEKTFCPDPHLVEAYEGFLSAYRSVHGNNPDLASIVYARLGDIFSVEESIEYDLFHSIMFQKRRRIELRNESLAEDCYLKALKLTPKDRDLHFAIMNLYEKAGNKPKAHRKIDEIIKLFPTDKEALFKAGADCIQRNAFQKAMKYLEQAIAIDPPDSETREYFQDACIKGALKYAGNSKLKQFRDLLPKAIEYGRRTSENYNLGHAYLYARWSVFELLAGDRDESERNMSLALENAANDLEIFYFTLLISKVYGISKKLIKDWEQRITKEFNKKASIETAVVFCTTLSSILPNRVDGRLNHEIERVNSYALKALKNECTREDAIRITDFAMSESNRNFHLTDKVIEKVLKKNPEDALFNFVKFKVDFTKKRLVHLPEEKDLESLRDILPLAEKEGDRRLIAEIRSFIDTLERSIPCTDDLFGDNDFYDDYDDDFDDPFVGIPEYGDPARMSGFERESVSEDDDFKKRKGKKKNNKQLNLFD